MYILRLVLIGIIPVLALAVRDKPPQFYIQGFSRIFEGERDFSITMMKQIRENHPNKNLFFSPFSTYNALLLAYFASSGQTEQELANVLNLNSAFNKEQVRSAYTVNKVIHLARFHQSPMELTSVNRIYVDKNVEVIDYFKTVLYDETEPIDFKNQPAQSLKTINEWIAKKTHNQIRDMLSSDEITSRTMLVLANAAYMKGAWLSQFKVEKTTQQPFYINDREQTMVPMMHQSATFKMNIDEHLQAQILKLPYRTKFITKDDQLLTPEDKSDVSMVLILPTSNYNNVNDLISQLDADSLKTLVEQSIPRELEVAVPKFQFEQRLVLTPILGNMGINKTFGSGSTFENLTPDHISIDGAQHMAKIKVDEMGSTAAAATILLASRSAGRPVPTKFICDHPFVFIIYDERVHTILFAGVYSDPREMEH
ncbi:serine protease inhibitor 88Ea-like [Drosophila takahashii]|uniref:serine protease inhibitor 88Ea-like n=1 Tax=Drosophila takahashii TaxID=29030 RepID=UPI001CF8B3F2|nr:serine protease inhibitor 88Ea-like [Drosophila takahashii]